MLSHLFFAALWSPAGKGLTSWFLLVMFNCVFVTFPCGILGQVWYLIVSIPYLYRLAVALRSRHLLGYEPLSTLRHIYSIWFYCVSVMIHWVSWNYFASCANDANYQDTHCLTCSACTQCYKSDHWILHWLENTSRCVILVNSVDGQLIWWSQLTGENVGNSKDIEMSHGMRFPTIWHCDKCRLRLASAASF